MLLLTLEESLGPGLARRNTERSFCIVCNSANLRVTLLTRNKKQDEIFTTTNHGNRRSSVEMGLFLLQHCRRFSSGANTSLEKLQFL